MGLFIGQSPQFVDFMRQLAKEADAAKRNRDRATQRKARVARVISSRRGRSRSSNQRLATGLRQWETCLVEGR
jgi:hypothetical protein